MSFSKPQVVIDLDEYNALLQIKKDSETPKEEISEEELSEVIMEMLESVRYNREISQCRNGIIIHKVMNSSARYGYQLRFTKEKK